MLFLDKKNVTELQQLFTKKTQSKEVSFFSSVRVNLINMMKKIIIKQKVFSE